MPLYTFQCQLEALKGASTLDLSWFILPSPLASLRCTLYVFCKGGIRMPQELLQKQCD